MLFLGGFEMRDHTVAHNVKFFGGVPSNDKHNTNDCGF